MMSQLAAFDLLAGRLEARRFALLSTALVALATAILVASSKMQVWVGPVPITMQSIAVILLALTIGAQRATAGAALYFVGCWTFPWFSATGNMPLSGGYVLGFVAAAWIAGTLFSIGHGRSFVKALFASSAANLVIFACGIPWLAASVGFERAWEVGGRPFVVAEVIKIAIGVGMLMGASRLSSALASRRD